MRVRFLERENIQFRSMNQQLGKNNMQEIIEH